MDAPARPCWREDIPDVLDVPAHPSGLLSQSTPLPCSTGLLAFPRNRYRVTYVAHKMNEHPLTNYLRAYRKKIGLSQEDIGQLVGKSDGSAMSRHELGRRIPSLETALIYEFVLGVPVRELYEELYDRLAEEVSPRAKRALKQGKTKGLPASVERELRRMSGTRREANPPATKNARKK